MLIRVPGNQSAGADADHTLGFSRIWPGKRACENRLGQTFTTGRELGPGAIPAGTAGKGWDDVSNDEAKGATAGTRQWTFLSNHGHVLVCLARDPEARLRDVAQAVGITERAVQKIVADLEAVGVLSRERTGRRNRYHLDAARPLRHPLESHRTIGALLSMVLTSDQVERLSAGPAQ